MSQTEPGCSTGASIILVSAGRILGLGTYIQERYTVSWRWFLDIQYL